MTDTPEITITVHGAVGIGKSAVALAIIDLLRRQGLTCNWSDESEERGLGVTSDQVAQLERKPTIRLVETNPSIQPAPVAGDAVDAEYIEVLTKIRDDFAGLLEDYPAPSVTRDETARELKALEYAVAALRRRLGVATGTGDGTGQTLPPLRVDSTAEEVTEHFNAVDAQRAAHAEESEHVDGTDDPEAMAAALLALSEALEAPCNVDDMLAQVDRLQRNAAAQARG